MPLTGVVTEEAPDKSGDIIFKLPPSLRAPRVTDEARELMA